jgi:hypothetical protein
MVIEVAKHNASVVSVGENIIACSNITEAFIDVFSVDYGKDFAIIKPAHRYINNDPVIKVDVIVNEQLYKDVEFILVKSNEQGIFINENSLADGILIEQSNQQPEIVEEEATAAEFYAEQLDKVVENAVVDQQQPCINVVDLKQQAKQQHQHKITQHLQTIQEELSDQVSFELQQTKQAVLSETLNLQNKIQQDNAEMVQQNIESFRQQLKEWALSTEQHLTAYAEEAIADVELQWTEKCNELLATNKEQVLEDLQQEISIATINSMAAIKQKLQLEIAAHLKTVDESNAKKDAAIDAFVKKQINQLHEQLEQSQMQKFDAKVADLLIKQHEWLQQNINEATNVYDDKLDKMSQQLNKVVAEASSDVVACIKNADASIEQKIQDALHQLNEKAQQLHEQRMQSIEQSVALVLKENIADDQNDVISEARSSARNAVRDALASYKSDVSKDLNAQLMNIQKELHAKMQMYVQSYGGGGSVAMQFADGGTMSGTLNVANGQILSAGVDLLDIFSSGSGSGYQTLVFNESTSQLTITPYGNTVSLSALSGGSGNIAFGNYLPLSGGTVTGDVTIAGTLSATTLYATSAYMTVIDITQYELSGFNVTGNVTVNGEVSATTMATNYIDFTPFSTAPIHVDGRLYYDAAEHTLIFYDGDPTLTYPINKMLWIIGVNKTGSIIPKGTVVYLSGAQGNRGKMWPALATSDLRSADTIGITMASTDVNAEGYIMTMGELQGIDTRAYPEGTTLYLSPTAAGAFTSIKPQAPQHIVKVGFSLNSTVNGKIYVEIDNGYELDELHNVRVNGVTNGQGLVYNSVSALWVNSDLYNGSDLKSLSANWQNTYTSFSSQSANDASVYSTVQSSSANWQNTYTQFSTQSANNISVYSIVQSNSATTWNYQGTDIKALTGNWQSTYTSFNAQSGNYATLAANTFTGAQTFATGSAAAVAATFVGAGSGTGIYSSGANTIDFAINGTRRVFIDSNGSINTNGSSIQINNGNLIATNTYLRLDGPALRMGASDDVAIGRDGASETLALGRRNTSANSLRVYNTYTSATNYERFTIDWQTKAGTCVVATSAGSTGGTSRGIEFRVGSTAAMSILSTAEVLVNTNTTFTNNISCNQDIEITDSTKGIILRSPSNFKYRVTVNDAGELITTLV